MIARQPGATSDWQVVELSAAQPEALVDLVLTRTTRTLTLRYRDGEPVTSAGFSSFTTAPAEEVAPGTYSLAMVPPQTELVIRPPLGAPLCKIVHAVGDVEAVVEPKRTVILRFEDPRVSAANVRIATATMDCPVPLERFVKTPFGAGPDKTRQIEILNAPADDVLIVHARDAVHRVIVSPDGVALVPAKQ